ncbi:hypothetical protein [Streptomyces roseolus]|uniref:hypothetical protein n=1 Tax=Streptomyces roseolus TaxID=67358 RepID=UPI00364F0DCE
MPNEKWHLDLKGDIEAAIGLDVPVVGGAEAVYRARDILLAAVLPHLEAAYKHGEVAGRSQAGYRLVAENERLRRQIPNPRKETE